jgi:hypothetical protein
MALPSPYVVELSFGSSGFVDVTSYVNSITIGKGISRQLDDYSAGTLSISFSNNDRTFDPLNTSSILWSATYGYTLVQPGGKIRVSTAGVRRFTGFIQSWDFTYDQAGFDGQAQVTALDEMFRISNQSFTGGTQRVVEASSERMKRVLNFNNISASEYAGIQSGYTAMGADINNPGDNVLSYLQNVARSEPGDLFSNASAVMVFKDRSFVNYTWANSDRQNLVLYPGTATVNTSVGTAIQNGWTYGYQAATAITPLYGGTTNKAEIVPVASDTEMAFTEVDLLKYNPDLVAGTSYVFSTWLKSDVGAVTVTGNFLVVDATNSYLGGVAPTANLSTSAWTQLSGTVTVASGTPAGINILVSAAGTTAAFGYYANGWQVERGTAIANYFDGTLNPYVNSATNRYDVAWLGDPYASSSGLIAGTASAVAAPTIYTFADANSQGTAYGNGTGIPFMDLSVAYGGEQLYNQVQVVGMNATALVSDSAGQTKYGFRAYAQTDNLTSSIVAPDRIAAGLLGEFRLPEYRATAMTVALEALTSGQQSIVLGLELRDVIRLCFQPSAQGAVVDKYYQILGVNSNSDVERDHITFTVASLDNLPIRLDSTFLAVLDTDTLA